MILNSSTVLAEIVLEIDHILDHKSVLEHSSVLQDVFAALLQECGICDFLFTSIKVWTQSRSPLSSERRVTGWSHFRPDLVLQPRLDKVGGGDPRHPVRFERFAKQ